MKPYLTTISTLLTLAICSLLCADPSFAQEPNHWKHYTNSSTPNCMIPDGKYLWIGTNAGLVKFDRSTKTYEVLHTSNSGLPLNSVGALAVDKSGALWAGTRGGGVARLKDGKWDQFNPREYPMGNGVVWTIAADSSGNVWFGSEGGLLRYSNGTFENFTPTNAPLASKTIYKVAADRVGGIWVATQMMQDVVDARACILHFDGKDWELHNSTTDTDIPSSDVFGIYVASNGNVWFGHEGSASRLQGRTWERFGLTHGFQGNYAFGLGEDVKGEIYVAASLDIGRFNGAGWNSFPDSPFYGGKAIVQEGNALWIAGYEDGGIGRYEDGKWETFSDISNSGLIWNNVNAMTIDVNGTYWFSGFIRSPLVSFDGHEWKKHYFVDGENESVSCLAADSSGNLWIGLGMYGLGKWDGKTLTRYDRSNSPLISNRFKTIAYDHKRKGLWLGGVYDQLSDSAMKGAMTWFDGVSEWRNYHKGNSNIPHTEINKIDIAPNGDLWLAFPYVGVGHWDGAETWTSYRTDNSDLPDNYASDLAIAKDGSVWVATNGGAAVFADGVWTGFSKSSSKIGSNSLMSVAIDTAGDVWFGAYAEADGGVMRYNGETWINYGILNSPIGSAFVQTMMTDRHGNIFAGTNDAGIAVYNYAGFGPRSSVHFERPASSNAIYPNPAINEITIQLSSASPAQVRVCDCLGRERTRSSANGALTLTIDVRSLETGSYVATIEQDGRATMQMVSVIR